MCATSWDIVEANVVCRELGFPGASSASGSSLYGGGKGQIWLDNVDCSGIESRLILCSHNGWGSHSCNHDNDASVECLPAVRLGAGESSFSRVEVHHSGSWRAACVNHLHIFSAANVVCKELGFPSAVNGTGLPQYQQDASVVLHNVTCSGNEMSIINCIHQGWKLHDCNENRHLGVICQT